MNTIATNAVQNPAIAAALATIVNDKDAAASILNLLAAHAAANDTAHAATSAAGYQIVPATTAPAPKRAHNRCTTLSPYKVNGQKKATAAQPIRTQDDFQAIANYLRTTGNARNRQRNYTVFVCGITLGLRVGDLLRLTIGDVYDIGAMTTRSHLTIINQKTHKRTTDMITPLAARAITALVDEIRTANNGALDPAWPLFQSQRGTRSCGTITPLSESQVYRFLTKAAAACNISGHISTHSMRKTYGYVANSTLAQKGLPAAQIMETLQAKFHHSDQSTTMRYIGLQQEQIDATALAVDAMLGCEPTA